MAYPQVAGYNTSFEAGNETSHTVNLPASISNGELLIVFFSTDGDNVATFPGGWTKIFNVSDTRDIHLSVAYRIADGNEEATITVTTTSSETSTHISFRITGHNSSTNAPEISTGAQGTNVNPDPDSLTATWGAGNNLWIAMSANDDNETVDAYPTNYDSNQHSLDGGGGPTLAVATYNYNTTDTQDPGTFTIGASEEWIAATLVVQPIYIPQLMSTIFI